MQRNDQGQVTPAGAPEPMRSELELARKNIESMLLHFTGTPSNLADSVARGKGHAAIGIINGLLAASPTPASAQQGATNATITGGEAERNRVFVNMDAQPSTALRTMGARCYVAEAAPASAGVPEGWRESLSELVQAMRDYQMDVDYEGSTPEKHREMMRRAEALLAAAPVPEAAQAAGFPERDQSKPAEQQGLFRKFIVNRVDGSDQPGGKHHGCRYYVLDLNHDQHAPSAIRAYAAACRATHPQLADDIEAEFGAAPSVQAVSSDAGEREKFEREVLRLDIIDDEGLERNEAGDYIDEPAQAAWRAWQAALTAHAGAQTAPAGKSPLSDERIAALYEQATSYALSDEDYAGVRLFVRAIESELASRCRAQGGATSTESAASPAPASAGVPEELPVELAGISEQVKAGRGFWTTCSGCHETEDGHPVGRYSYSTAMNCALGTGCSECGGIGAVWDNNDYESMVADFAAAPVPEAAQAEPMNWNDCKRISDLPAVHEALMNFSHDATMDNAVCIVRAVLETQGAAPSVQAVSSDAGERWLPMNSAPQDGTMLRLLVAFTDHATEDSAEPCPTIGANNFDHDGIDAWKFAGWNWSHDCFTEGAGTPVGWMPMLTAHAGAQTAPNCGACPGDGSICKASCKLADESPASAQGQPCPKCKGKGEWSLDGMACTCMHCGGVGTLAAAYKVARKLDDAERAKYKETWALLCAEQEKIERVRKAVNGILKTPPAQDQVVRDTLESVRIALIERAGDSDEIFLSSALEMIDAMRQPSSTSGGEA